MGRNDAAIAAVLMKNEMQKPKKKEAERRT